MPVETMLRVYFLRNRYALRDRMAEEKLYDAKGMLPASEPAKTWRAGSVRVDGFGTPLSLRIGRAVGEKIGCQMVGRHHGHRMNPGMTIVPAPYHQP